MNNFTGYPQVWMYQTPFSRVLMESLEVALIICNKELPQFTSAKLFDIMNQIIPTGFVLTTGYWPFYSSNKRQSLCVCGRFSLDCRHNRHTHHWIDLDPIPNDNSTLFYPGRYGPLNLAPIDIGVVPTTTPPVGFVVNLQLKFGYGGSTNKGIRRAKRLRQEHLPMGTSEVNINSIYTLKSEWYPAFRSILFQPNPYFSDFYGLHMPKLLVDREQFTQNPQFNYGSFFVETGTMPQFTILMDRCNVPVYTTPVNYTTARYNLVETENNYVETQLEVWKYRERISSCKPIWNNTHQPADENVTEIPFSVDDFIAQFAKTTIDSIEPIIQVDENNNAATSIQIINTSATETKPNVVRKRRRKIQYQHVQTFGDTTTTTPRSTFQTNPFPIGNLENPQMNVTIANYDFSTEIANLPLLSETEFQWLEDILK